MNLTTKIISTVVLVLAASVSIACSSTGSGPETDSHATTPPDYNWAEIAREHGYVTKHHLVIPIQVNTGWEDCTIENGLPSMMLTMNTAPPDAKYYARGEPGDTFSAVVVTSEGEYQCLLGILSDEQLPDSTNATR